MSKTKTIKDLSSTYNNIPSAEQELEIPLGTNQLGQRVGGVAMNSNSFRRGYGNETFGSGPKGIWLGAADYDDAKFRVSLGGSMYAQSNDGGMTWDNENNRILIAVSGTDQILIGEF